MRYLKLADPSDEKHMPIEILIIITTPYYLDEIFEGSENETVAMNSYLGWIVSGSLK